MCPPLDPKVADTAPTSEVLTGCDLDHLSSASRGRCSRFESPRWCCTSIRNASLGALVRSRFIHLARAKWMTECGYRRHLLRGSHKR